MIIVFFGENNFITKRKLKETIENYKEKHRSGLGLFSFSNNNFSFDKFKDAVETVSMFDEKKCIVLDNLFFDSRNLEFLTEYFEKNKIKEDKDIFVIIKEDGLFKKTDKEFKILLEKPAMVYESKKFSNSQLKSWIEKEALLNKASISSVAVSKLILSCKDDLWRLSNEIAKLASYDKKITENSVDFLVEQDIESDIFRAIEYLAKKDKINAVNIFYNQISSGKNISYLISMIAFQFRNMLKIKELLDKGVSLELIIKKTKIHPFAVRKILSSLKIYSLEELKKIYKKLLNTDIKIKTSKIDPSVILDDFILNI
jgi:DNA polymerase-3 subunit delta